MNFIFSTGSLWTYSIERCFAFAAEAGFDGLELMVDNRFESRQPNYLQTLMAKYGLPIEAVHSPFQQVPGWPVDHPGLVAHSVELAEAVGAKVVIHHLPDRIGLLWVKLPGGTIPVPVPGWRPHQDYRDWLANGGYAALQAKTAVKLCIENMPAHHRLGRRWNINHWNSPAAMQRFPHITLDTTHVGTWELQPVDEWPHYNGRVAHIHLSNYNGKEHQHVENGRLHLDKFLAQVAADQYEGAVSLEVFPGVLDAGEPDAQVIARLTENLQLMRDWEIGD